MIVPVRVCVCLYASQCVCIWILFVCTCVLCVSVRCHVSLFAGRGWQTHPTDFACLDPSFLSTGALDSCSTSAEQADLQAQLSQGSAVLAASRDRVRQAASATFWSITCSALQSLTAKLLEGHTGLPTEFMAMVDGAFSYVRNDMDEVLWCFHPDTQECAQALAAARARCWSLLRGVGPFLVGQPAKLDLEHPSVQCLVNFLLELSASTAAVVAPVAPADCAVAAGEGGGKVEKGRASEDQNAEDGQKPGDAGGSDRVPVDAVMSAAAAASVPEGGKASLPPPVLEAPSAEKGPSSTAGAPWFRGLDAASATVAGRARACGEALLAKLGEAIAGQIVAFASKDSVRPLVVGLHTRMPLRDWTTEYLKAPCLALQTGEILPAAETWLEKVCSMPFASALGPVAASCLLLPGVPKAGVSDEAPEKLPLAVPLLRMTFQFGRVLVSMAACAETVVSLLKQAGRKDDAGVLLPEANVLEKASVESLVDAFKAVLGLQARMREMQLSHGDPATLTNLVDAIKAEAASLADKTFSAGQAIVRSSYTSSLRDLLQDHELCSDASGVLYAAVLIEQVEALTDDVVRESTARTQSKAAKKLFRRWKVMDKMSAALPPELDRWTPAAVEYGNFLGAEVAALEHQVHKVMSVHTAIAGLAAPTAARQAIQDLKNIGRMIGETHDGCSGGLESLPPKLCLFLRQLSAQKGQ